MYLPCQKYWQSNPLHNPYVHLKEGLEVLQFLMDLSWRHFIQGGQNQGKGGRGFPGRILQTPSISRVLLWPVKLIFMTNNLLKYLRKYANIYIRYILC